MSFNPKITYSMCSLNSGYIDKVILKNHLDPKIKALKLKYQKERFLSVYILPAIHGKGQEANLKNSENYYYKYIHEKYLPAFEALKGKLICIYHNVRYQKLGSICMLVKFTYDTKLNEFVDASKEYEDENLT